MSLAVFAWGIVFFLAAFIGHVMLWRFARPKGQIAALMAIFVVLPLIGFGGWLVVSADRLNVALASVLYVALAGVYIQTYPAIQANAPSLFIVYVIGRSKHGLSVNALAERMKQTGLTGLEERLKDLVNDSLIAVSANQTVSLTRKGRILVLLMISLRQKVLGLREGEG